MTPGELAASYRGMSESELMALAQTYSLLSVAAQDALRAEFAKRRLEPPLLEGEDLDGDDGAESRRLVTVRRYRDLSEAIVARSMLESAGLTVYLYDENLVRLDWQISNFIGGIRLQVEVADREAATELLDQPVPDDIAYDDEAAGGTSYEQPRCPVCTSREITYEGASRAAPVAALWLLQLPLPPGRRTWRCENCGARWEDDGPEG